MKLHSTRFISFAAVLIAAFMLAGATPAQAQDAGSQNDSQHEGHSHAEDGHSHGGATQSAPVEEVERSPAFEEKYDEWKTALVGLYEVRNEFSFAEIRDVQSFREKWQNAVARSEKALTEMYEVGIAEYERRGVKDSRIGGILQKQAGRDVDVMLFGRAHKVYSMLLDTKIQFFDDQLVKAAKAAFYSNDFAIAKRFYEEANMMNVLDSDPAAKGVSMAIPALIAAHQREQKLIERDKQGEPLPQVRIKTTKGEMLCELYENDCPNTVANFISLANNSFFEKNPLVPDSMLVITGSSTPDDKNGALHKIAAEADAENFRAYFRGALVMLPDKNGLADSRFAICQMPIRPTMYGKWTCFGRVIEGIDTLRLLNVRTEKAGPDFEWDEILEVEVVRKRDHEYKVEKTEKKTVEKIQE